MQLATNIELDPSAEISWKRLEGDLQDSIIAKLKTGYSKQGTASLEVNGMRVLYQISDDLNHILIFSIATQREQIVLRR